MLTKGMFLQRMETLLATSVSEYTIYMDLVPIDDHVFEENVGALSKELAALLGKSSKHFENKLRSAKARKKRYYLIARNVGYTDYLKMKQFPIFNLGMYKGGFIAEQKTIRKHPIGKIAERTIGYDDYRGEAGIEGAFATYIAGKNGLRWKQKIARGRWKPISDVNEKEPIDGRDIITTLDVNIQDIAHHALLRQLEYFEADHGCAVVMEVSTGEIKAIANLGRTSKGKYYEKRNYAIWERHEPGSTFKLASLLAALDDKIIDTSTMVDTKKGKIFIHNKKVEDSKKGGYGKISAARAFEVSSNVGIVKLIRKAYDKNPQKFIDKIASYGFTKPIGFPIKGEGIPYIPTPSDKNSWSKISLEWMSWGYGISVTPMQILMFYNAVANNGVMVKPRFIKELRNQEQVEITFETEVINKAIARPETLKKIKRVMENVVKKGTASDLYSPDFSMAGKTGTAKKVVNGVYSNKSYVASFAGFFPADTPKYSCIVMIDSPKKEKGYYGATVAAPVFKEIAQKIFSITPVQRNVNKAPFTDNAIDKEYTKYNEMLGSTENTIPNVIGMSGMDAISLLENVGLKVTYHGVGNVKYQSLAVGTKIKKGTTIVLKLS